MPVILETDYVEEQSETAKKFPFNALVRAFRDELDECKTDEDVMKVGGVITVTFAVRCGKQSSVISSTGVDNL